MENKRKKWNYIFQEHELRKKLYLTFSLSQKPNDSVEESVLRSLGSRREVLCLDSGTKCFGLNLSSITWPEEVPEAPCASASPSVRLGLITVRTSQGYYED